ncbi:MAG TPA: exopolyphosphatase [Acidimicrobiia bacterium]|nr:exopolyphosphatase [Acidimicrobiia bacterium]
MRLLLVQQVGSGIVELGRFERVTGLGRGVEAAGLLSEEAMDRTLLALAEFGARMNEARVDRRRAVATSASRDAANSGLFFDRAELALGVRPELISGEEEARLAFAGASRGRPEPLLVIDIGGGSTEFVTHTGGTSYEIGSVRLTDRLLAQRPVESTDLASAREMVAEAFQGVTPFSGSVLGVAGTWTSLGAMEESESLSGAAVTAWVERLAAMSLAETAGIPGLDPDRAPVMLGGAIVAEGAMTAVAAEAVVVSHRDLLDGVIASLIGASF